MLRRARRTTQDDAQYDLIELNESISRQSRHIGIIAHALAHLLHHGEYEHGNLATELDLDTDVSRRDWPFLVFGNVATYIGTGLYSRARSPHCTAAR